MKRWKLALSATAIWFVFSVIAVVCGAAREAILTPRTGPHIAHVVGSHVVIALFSIIISFYVGAIQASKVSLIRIGLYWLLLTVAFELFFGHYVMGRPWEAVLADYNLLRGRLWVLVLAAVVTVHTPGSFLG
jgi:hypothetical protein